MEKTSKTIRMGVLGAGKHARAMMIPGALFVDKQKVVTLDFESGDLGSVIGTGFPTTNVPCERVDVSTSAWLIQAEYGEELRVIRDIPSESISMPRRSVARA